MRRATRRDGRIARGGVRSRSGNGQSFFNSDEDVNPMEYLSNLSDVMLILAVGIMLALILHWNVEINTSADATENPNKESVTFSDDDLESTDDMPEDAQAMGTVYYDPDTGKYYYRIDN